MPLTAVDRMTLRHPLYDGFVAVERKILRRATTDFVFAPKGILPGADGASLRTAGRDARSIQFAVHRAVRQNRFPHVDRRPTW